MDWPSLGPMDVGEDPGCLCVAEVVDDPVLGGWQVPAARRECEAAVTVCLVFVIDRRLAADGCEAGVDRSTGGPYAVELAAGKRSVVLGAGLDVGDLVPAVRLVCDEDA